LIAALCAPRREIPLALPRTMVVIAHPDDETVGAGSRLHRLAPARFVHVTDGAPRDGHDASRHGFTPAEYAAARRRELEAALALCDIPSTQLLALEYPDQQASLHLAELAARLAGHFAEERIEAVLTHSYEGGHPDHDATAFAVHAAAALMHARREAPPDIVEMALYHLDRKGLRGREFLPDADADREIATVHLTPEEQRHKRALVACFATQSETLRNLCFDVERFRPAPRYDFLAPPHAGKLYYEQHPWGMSGERFRALARQALSQLRLEGRL
jgi:N-acetylglucosamine malate deacetylase 2